MSDRFKKLVSVGLIATSVMILLSMAHPIGQAQTSNFNCDVAETQPVIFEQNSLFCVGKESNISAQDRALVIARRMQDFLATSLPVDRIRQVERTNEAMSLLVYDTDEVTEKVFLTVTDLDTSNINPDRTQLADAFLQEIKIAIRDAQTRTNTPNLAPQTQGQTGDAGKTDAAAQPAQKQPASAFKWEGYVWMLVLSLPGLLLLGLLLGCVSIFENAIAGLLLRKQIKPGNQVMLNHDVGTIQTISLLSTKLLSEDGITVTIMPNSTLLKQPIKLSSTTQLTNLKKASK